jgi:large subunit ribosomal protein L10
MNRDQKAAVIEEIAGEIETADAVFAVDYRGLSVPQAAELRGRLREADANFRIVKNSLTERAADQAGAEALKELLQGPTALTFVRGDAALAAKAIADYARTTRDLLPFKGGLLDGELLDGDQIRAISRLPSRDVLYGQLVGVVASPLTGLVRTLNALIGGLAVALEQVREKKESGELPAGDPPAAAAAAAPEPDAATPEPEAVAPEAATPEPEAVASDAATPEPEAVASEAATPEPEAVAPEAATPEPEAVAPEAATPEPGAAPPEPETSPDASEATAETTDDDPQADASAE